MTICLLLTAAYEMACTGDDGNTYGDDDAYGDDDDTYGDSDARTMKKKSFRRQRPEKQARR